METVNSKEEYILTKDPVFVHGRELIKEAKYDDAIDFFAGILQQRAKEYGNDMVYECASAWYEYANALLIKEEDAPSDNLLTNTEKPAEPAGEDNDEDGEEEETPADIEVPDEGETQDKNPSTQEGAPEEDVNDLQVAWECFEVCRQLYEAKIESFSSDASILATKDHQDIEISLSNVYIRLGDLQIINNKFAQALEDYGKALSLRQRICAPYDRMLSDVYYSMALAYVYSCSNSNQSEEPTNPSDQPQALDPAQVIEYKKRALQHYDLAKSVLASWIEHKMRLQPEPSEVIAEEIRKQRELIEELDENIVALREEVIAEESLAQPTTRAAATTTIGFGFGASTSSSSSSSSFPPMTTNDYFMNLASSTTAAAEVPVVNTLQPKRKEKAISNATLAIPANENHPDNDAAPNKKAKLENS